MPMILQQTGKQVDAFFANLVDLIATEDITQERLATGTVAGGMPAGTILQDQEHLQDSYLIVRRDMFLHGLKLCYVLTVVDLADDPSNRAAVLYHEHSRHCCLLPG